MRAVVALLALAAVALAQVRPQISEDFYAAVRTELHTQQGVLFGDGHWAIDTELNKGVENYQFQDDHQRPFYVFNLERYDIGWVYHIDSYDGNKCNATAVTGNMPSTWGWVQYANYSGNYSFHGLNLDMWSFTIAGTTLKVGVHAPDYNTPVVFDRSSTTGELFIEFAYFDPTNNFEHDVFFIPPQCNQTAAPHFRATPQRPNISENFEAEVNVDFLRNDETIYGEGRWAADQTDSRFVEEYDLHPNHGGQDIRVLNLLRWDLGEAFSINSVNQSDCYKQNLTGTMPPTWGWVAQATFVGQHPVRSHGVLDLWNLVIGGVNLTLGVFDSQPNYPVFFSREYTGAAEHYDFVEFYPDNRIDPDDFNIPPECNHN